MTCIDADGAACIVCVYNAPTDYALGTHTVFCVRQPIIMTHRVTLADDTVVEFTCVRVGVPDQLVVGGKAVTPARRALMQVTTA